MNQVPCKLFDALVAFALCEPILNGDILSFDPAQLVQLLPERVHHDRHTGSIAWIQEPDAEDFPRLLRLNWNAQRNEHSAKRKDGNFSHHVFFSLDQLATRHLTLAPPHLM